MNKLIWTLCALGIIAGCADGSALVTGQVRPPIEDYSSVSILTEMPESAEEIAIVNASSDSGFNQQERLNYAVEELKRQAAKVGANTVVLTDRETSSNVYGGETGVYSSEIVIVKGIAVYVP